MDAARGRGRRPRRLDRRPERLGLPGAPARRRSHDRAAAARAAAVLRGAPRLHRRAGRRSRPVAQRRLGRRAAQPFHRPRFRSLRQPIPFEALPREYDQAVQKFGRAVVHEQGLLPWRTAEFYGRLQRVVRVAGPAVAVALRARRHRAVLGGAVPLRRRRPRAAPRRQELRRPAVGADRRALAVRERAVRALHRRADGVADVRSRR